MHRLITGEGHLMWRLAQYIGAPRKKNPPPSPKENEKDNRGVGRREKPKKPSKKPQKAGQPPVTRLLAKRSMMRGQRGRSAPTLLELRRDRDQTGRAGEHPRC